MGTFSSAFANARLLLTNAHDPSVVFVGGHIVLVGGCGSVGLSWIWDRVYCFLPHLVHSAWGIDGKRALDYRDGSGIGHSASGAIAPADIGIFRWREFGHGWGCAPGLVAQSPG